MMDREQILARNPLVSFIEGLGVPLKSAGGKLTSNRCAIAEHKPGHQCVDFDAEKQVWYCHDCREGGSVIDWLMKSEGIPPAEAMKRLGGDESPAPRSQATPAPSQRASDPKAKLLKTYDYTDENGKLLFQVCRYEPKDFRQRAPDGAGGWVHKLEGVRRVPYNLPKIPAADFVMICEGEKDADTLNALGWVATTNCGGAKKWEESYTAFFRGKDVAILPDNDKPGGEHRDLLRSHLRNAVKSLRIIEMPEGIKDVTELFETFATNRDFSHAFMEMCERAEVLYRGEPVPIQTMEELEEEYRAHIKRAKTHQLVLSDWLPALRSYVRPLVPGELFSILAGTGCGKTMFLQNLALHTHLETLLFETELPGTLSFERFAAMAASVSARFVEKAYSEGNSVDWRKSGRLARISCCHKSKVTPEEIERIINAAELKTSRRPVLVLIDYIQLIKTGGKSRYESTSDVAEQLKIVAKNTGTIIVMASQIGRPDKTKKVTPSREVSLSDGKDSGSIENSSGLVIGGWRDEEDKDRLWLKVLKNTKGTAGLSFACRINDSLQIEQENTEPEPEPALRPDPRKPRREE